MTAIAITGMGLTGVLRVTRVQDNLAHVLDHGHTDETLGTWTSLACRHRAYGHLRSVIHRVSFREPQFLRPIVRPRHSHSR